MSSVVFNFILRIVFILAVAFGAHLFILDFLGLPLFSDKIILAYLINAGLAVVIYTALYTLRKKFEHQIGFLFIAGSFVKVALFFLLFNTPYKADGQVTGSEVFAFFVPYVLSLIIEIFSISKWLNKLGDSTS